MHHRLSSSRAARDCSFVCRTCRRNLQRVQTRRFTQPTEHLNRRDTILENLGEASHVGSTQVKEGKSPAASSKNASQKSHASESNSGVAHTSPPQRSKSKSHRGGNHVNSESRISQSDDGPRSSKIAHSGAISTPEPGGALRGRKDSAWSNDRLAGLHDKPLLAPLFAAATPLANRTGSPNTSKPSPLLTSKANGAKALSLADKIIEARNRKPWGDRGTVDTRTVGAASYDSLRKADKVSPPPDIPTAHNMRGFGIEPNRKSAVFPNSTNKPIEDPSEQEQTLDRTPSVVGRVSNFFLNMMTGTSSSSGVSAKSSNQEGVATSSSNPSVTVTSNNTESSNSPPSTTRNPNHSPKTPIIESEDLPTGQSPSSNKGNSPKDKPAPNKSTRSKPKEAAGEAASEPQSSSVSSESPDEKSEASVEPDLSTMSKAERKAFNIQTAKTLAADAKARKAAKAAKAEQLNRAKAEKKAETKQERAEQAKAAKAHTAKTRQKRKERVAERRKEMQALKASHATKAKSRIRAVTSEGKMSLTEAMSASRRVTAPPRVEDSDVLDGTQFGKDLTYLTASELEITPLDIPQPPVPALAHGLDRVLFNPGVYHLQDPSSRVYNFDPYLEKIMPVGDFNFKSLREYKTSSKDDALLTLAKEYEKKYIGSTSSMTSTLAQFHFLLSNWRAINLEMFSAGFVGKEISSQYTKITQSPAAIFLRHRDGSYAVDADKEFDSANVLMMLGKSMELLLTLPVSEFERYRKTDPRQITEEEKMTSESYQYSTTGDFLLRSQLDAYDSRLPGTGVFDLKTRAVVSVRMSSKDYEPMTGYEIESLRGKWTSYEREYYDMLRATALKYMLQARIGFMNGIFVAYHNVERIFGFQFVPISEMDLALHGQTDPCLGDQEYKVSMNLFNQVLEKATAKFPNTSLRIHTKTTDGANNKQVRLQIFVEPMSEEQIDAIQNSQKAEIAEYERKLMQLDVDEDGIPPLAGPLEGRASAETASREARLDVEPAAAAEDSDSVDTQAEQESLAGNTVEAPLLSLDHGENKDCVSGSDEKKSLAPLFMAVITVRNNVNGLRCESNRPKNLKPSDNWEVEYEIEEYDSSPTTWAAYEDLKADRKQILAEARDEEVDTLSNETKDANPQGLDLYLRFLRRLADAGRKRRVAADELDKDRGVVALGNPVAPASLQYRPARAQDIAVEDVHDYMAWLYDGKRL